MSSLAQHRSNSTVSAATAPSVSSARPNAFTDGLVVGQCERRHRRDVGGERERVGPLAQRVGEAARVRGRRVQLRAGQQQAARRARRPRPGRAAGSSTGPRPARAAPSAARTPRTAPPSAGRPRSRAGCRRRSPGRSPRPAPASGGRRRRAGPRRGPRGSRRCRPRRSRPGAEAGTGPGQHDGAGAVRPDLPGGLDECTAGRDVQGVAAFRTVQLDQPDTVRGRHGDHRRSLRQRALPPSREWPVPPGPARRPPGPVRPGPAPTTSRR